MGQNLKEHLVPPPCASFKQPFTVHLNTAQRGLRLQITAVDKPGPAPWEGSQQ